MSHSVARQNYHAESEAAINRQINLELNSSYMYMSLAGYFDRDDVALHGFHAYFEKRGNEEREDAEKLIKYQNMRGGRVLLATIRKPERDEWGSGLDALAATLEMQKAVNASLLEVHDIANKHGDPQMSDFIESDCLERQVELIKQIANHIANLKRVGPGLGEYQFDHVTLKD